MNESAAIEIGRLLSSREVIKLMDESKLFEMFVGFCLGRHSCGDWGDLDEHDRDLSDLGLATGSDVWSAYRVPVDLKESGRANHYLYVTTRLASGVTSIMFADEY